MNVVSLSHIKYMPQELSPGTLYVSIEYAIAGHQCACGCGNKVITPLGPAEWNFSERNGRPTLRPSIGNWQLPCRSHYWITDGRVQWAAQWSEEEIEAGRKAEERGRDAYYASLEQKRGFWFRLREWIKKLLFK